MLSSRPTRWMLALACGALFTAGCSTTTDTPQGETGSLSLDLVLSNGVEIDEVGWQITGNGMDMSGDIDVSAPGSTASVEVFGLPPTDKEKYVVTLSAVSVDGEVTCKGSEPFEVKIGVSTDVMVMLNCKLPQTLGGVRVNGKFNICAELAKMVVSPLQTSVGNDIDLSALGIDVDGDPIKYIWSASGGSIADPNAASTTYTCAEIGLHEITVNVTDNDTYCRMAQWTVPVTCVEGDGDLCEGVECEDDGNECTETNCDPSDGICKSENVDDGTDCNGDAGMCMDGECVDADRCEDVVCEDDNECTNNVCNPLDGECGYPPVDDGTDCEGGDGMCVDGTCIVDRCEGIICEPTLNDCTVGLCNTETGECDETNVPNNDPCNDGAGACLDGECIDNNLCEGKDCTSANDCIQDGTCDAGTGDCIAGDDEPLGTPCADGVCDGQGTCVGCNVPDDCTGDPGQCEAKACLNNACSIVIIMDGAPCDLTGTGDGICEAGTCVEAPECESPGDCNDGNPCTAGACPDGMCVFAPVDGGTCEVSAGVPGICSGGGCVGLCVGEDCTSNSQCVMDGTCDDQTGECIPGDNEPADTACTVGGSVCDGAGSCVECNVAGQCPDDGEECTTATCSDNQCGQDNVTNGTSCDGGNGECQTGSCEPLGPPTFALAGEFRAYNNLLPAEGAPPSCEGDVPAGPPVGTCTEPSLCGVPDSTICQACTTPGPNAGECGVDADGDVECLTTGFCAPPTSIDVFCISETPGGVLSFDDDGAGNVSISGNVDLSFVINASIDLAQNCSLIVPVQITTVSSTIVAATGAGSVSTGNTVVLDQLPPPDDAYNVSYGPVTGSVNCDAGVFSTTICPLAGLAPGNNPVPLPGDPGARQWPDLSFSGGLDTLTFEMGSGPDSTDGWFVNNADGNQFLTLVGTQ